MNVSLSKTGHDFSNKVVQKLTLEKMFLTKNFLLCICSKIYKWKKFKKRKKICWFLTSKIDLKSMSLALFVKLSFIDRILNLFFPWVCWFLAKIQLQILKYWTAYHMDCILNDANYFFIIAHVIFIVSIRNKALAIEFRVAGTDFGLAIPIHS